MKLSNGAQLVLDRLENAGFPTYAVGGCVRDQLLGLEPHDFDLCTAALPQQLRQLFDDRSLILAGEKHGTVGIVTEDGVIEVTTFRTETGYHDGRHPDQVEFVPCLEADLARRDFTVNAIAWSPIRGLQDPFRGAEDLARGILRAVGDPEKRFAEDSLRILRGVRFAVRFRLTPEAATLRAMTDLAPCMDQLARERVYDELCRLLPLITAQDLLCYAPILIQVIPELAPAIGFCQHSPHHAYDVYTHIAQVVGRVPARLPLRWAALLHDVGKMTTFTLDETGRGHFYGHARESARIAEDVLLRLKAPTALRRQVVTLVDQHMTYPDPDKKQLRRRLSRLGADMLRDLLILQQADTGSKGINPDDHRDYFAAVHQLLDQISREDRCLGVRDLAVNGHDLLALGLSGPAIGKTLDHLLELVMDEQLPNEKAALLRAAVEMLPF